MVKHVVTTFGIYFVTVPKSHLDVIHLTELLYCIFDRIKIKAFA